MSLPLEPSHALLVYKGRVVGPGKEPHTIELLLQTQSPEVLLLRLGGALRTAPHDVFTSQKILPLMFSNAHPNCVSFNGYKSQFAPNYNSRQWKDFWKTYFAL